MFKPAVFAIEGGLDQQHGRNYGSDDYHAGWRLQVTHQVYARLSKYGGILEVNVQNEARIYAKLFGVEYDLLWAAFFFVGGFSFLGVPTGLCGIGGMRVMGPEAQPRGFSPSCGINPNSSRSPNLSPSPKLIVNPIVAFFFIKI